MMYEFLSVKLFSNIAMHRKLYKSISIFPFFGKYFDCFSFITIFYKDVEVSRDKLLFDLLLFLNKFSEFETVLLISSMLSIFSLHLHQLERWELFHKPSVPIKYVCPFISNFFVVPFQSGFLP